jgi:hypothetical protein
MTIIPRWFARFRPCSIATGLRVTLGALLVEWSEKFNVFAVRAEELIEKNRPELVAAVTRMVASAGPAVGIGTLPLV